MKMKAANWSRAQKSFAVVKLTRLLLHTRAIVEPEISRAHSNKTLFDEEWKIVFLSSNAVKYLSRDSIEKLIYSWMEWRSVLCWNSETEPFPSTKLTSPISRMCIDDLFVKIAWAFFCCCCLLSSHNSHFHNSNAALAELSYLKSEFQGACLTQFRVYRFDCASCYKARTSTEDHHHNRSCRVMRNVKLPPNQISIIISVWQHKKMTSEAWCLLCVLPSSAQHISSIHSSDPNCERSWATQ